MMRVCPCSSSSSEISIHPHSSLERSSLESCLAKAITLVMVSSEKGTLGVSNFTSSIFTESACPTMSLSCFLSSSSSEGPLPVLIRSVS